MRYIAEDTTMLIVLNRVSVGLEPPEELAERFIMALDVAFAGRTTTTVPQMMRGDGVRA